MALIHIKLRDPGEQVLRRP